MFTTGNLRTHKQRSPSAAVARERLLHDPTMRHHNTGRIAGSRLPASPVTVTFPALFIDPHADEALAHQRLSPEAQHWQAVQVARSFKNHYLAEVHYCDDRQSTIAVIRPIHVRRNSNQGPQEICVDSAGNVNLSHLGARQSLARRVLSRMLVVAAVVCVAYGVFVLGF